MICDSEMRRKAVSATEWKLHKLPKQKVSIRVDRPFSPAEMEKIKAGFRPDSMDDHWFIYYEKERLYIHRSWSGNCIYVVRFENGEQGWFAREIKANRNPKQYTADSTDYDAKLAFWVIDWFLLEYDTEMPEHMH